MARYESVQISENYWKHTANGSICYTTTSDPESELHREDGPAIEFKTGSKYWYINGKCHRENGPAVECANGDKVWWINGKRHREDGPAVEYADGSKEWWIDGKRLNVNSQEEFEEYLRKNSDKPVVVKKEVSSAVSTKKEVPAFVFRMEFSYSCQSKKDLSKEKMVEAFLKQIEECLE